MRVPKIFIVALLALCSAPAWVHAKPRAVAELFPANTTVAPGQSFELAVRFKIDRAWHLYWINPGDTGRAPRIKWTLPAGVTVSDAQFPVPHRIVLSDGLTSFGYETELVLLAKVTVGSDVAGPIELKASLNWIVCKTECVAESQSASTTVIVAEASIPAADRVESFAKWRAEQPQREGTPAAQVALDADRKHGEIRIDLPKDLTPTEFFPPAAPFAEYEMPRLVEKRDGQRSYVVRFRVLPGQHQDRTDPAVLVATDLAGKSVAFEIACRFQMNLQ